MQLRMQIQCNHGQKQTENELLGTIVKINQQSNTEYNSLILRDKNKPLLFLVRVYLKTGTPTGNRTPVTAVKGRCPNR